MNALPRIGVVLSSGGIRGIYAHTGFLQALDKLGVPIAASTGCSAGAVVGGIAASGTDVNAWADALLEVHARQFWTPDPLWRFLWQITVRKGRGYTGLSGSEAAISFVRKHLSTETFEDCLYPFHALAVDIAQNRKVMFSSGELAPRMVASAAMPILYRPVEIDSDMYCDGALIDLAPTDAICCLHDLDVLIVHHVSQRSVGEKGIKALLQQPWSMIRILNRLLYFQRPWYLSDESLSFMHCPCGCGAVVIVIEPELPDLVWPLTDGGVRIQQIARQQTEQFLDPFLEALQSDPRNNLPVTKEWQSRTTNDSYAWQNKCGLPKQEEKNGTC